MSEALVAPMAGVGGNLRVPGDKSISHRTVMLGAIAEGESRVSGFLAGEDPLATLAAFEQMGVTIERPATDQVRISGVGLWGLRQPTAALDVGNSGTSIRLLAGLLAGQRFGCTLDGDASIRRRPMKRVIEPLTQMGARIAGADEEGHAPLRIEPLPAGGRLKAIAYASPVASAQVKSAVLLAGLYAEGKTCVREPLASRDHTERMLRHLGVNVEQGEGGVCVSGGQRLRGADIAVPGDISSAAFFLVTALLAREGALMIEGVGVNPTRDGIIEALRAMGGRIELKNPREQAGEPVADLCARPSPLGGTRVSGALIPRMIDELPALAVAAAFADGETVIADAAELRVKESDRIATMCEELGKLGVRAEPRADGMRIVGDPSRRVRATKLSSHGDHRVAMSLAACATRAEGALTICDVGCVATSFPGFFDLLKRAGR